MGYDCYTVDAAGENAKCDDLRHGDHYYRRSIFGMLPQAERLVAAGLAYWSVGSPGDWPERPENLQYDEDSDSWVGSGAEAFMAAQHAYLKDTHDERPGIAAYKLCGSNDGWWVTRAECQSALQLWEKAGRPVVDEYDDTIPFLQAGADHDGFRVW